MKNFIKILDDVIDLNSVKAISLRKNRIDISFNGNTHYPYTINFVTEENANKFMEEVCKRIQYHQMENINGIVKKEVRRTVLDEL